MVNCADIAAFFDGEAMAAKRSHEELMSLSLEARIRRRKAISGITVDSWKEDGYYLVVSMYCRNNLSDFREGDVAVLHTEEGLIPGVRCTLQEFSEDGTWIGATVFFRDGGVLEKIAGKGPLVLDRDLADLRKTVFSKFLDCLCEGDLQRVFSPGLPSFTDDGMLGRFLETFGTGMTPGQKEAVEKCYNAEDYYLVQGPPGTGKSFVLATVIAAEVILRGRKVIVSGPNHMAVNNVLVKVADMFPELKERLLKTGQHYYAPGNGIRNMEYASSVPDDVCVVGLTPYSLYTRRAGQVSADVLVIDEAGQMAVPLALMAMLRAGKCILCGDHRQLPPVMASEMTVPELSLSVFENMFSPDNCTMLDVSFRMCGPLCAFVSSLFYNGVLKPFRDGADRTVLCDDPLVSFDVPVVMCDVSHSGMQVSDQEAERIGGIVRLFRDNGVSGDDIAVLAPFRAQVARIRREVSGVYVDTVDRMQGQERKVIILSMTSGDRDYVAETADFLFSPNKLNVAFSRAVSKLVIVGCVSSLRENALFASVLASEYVKTICR